jgi:ribosomal-protein-alanine N-acetyltransferase
MIKLISPLASDEQRFLTAMMTSVDLYKPFVDVPTTHDQYTHFLKKAATEQDKSFLIINEHNDLCGVVTLSQIVKGVFQSAYLGFYAVSDFAGKGIMSEALDLILKKVFIELKLHRVEANIQPSNIKSIQLIQKKGFKKEGLSENYLFIQDGWRDHERWALTAENYQQLT